jgi:hypothetical protein
MCEVWPTVLEDILDACPGLEELTLHKVNRLDENCMRRIAQVSSLRRLMIHHKPCLDYRISTLFKMLDQLHNLQELKLDGSSFDDGDLDSLLQVLSASDVLSNLKLISFKSCLLSDEAVARIVNAISQDQQRLQSIQTMDFSINQCYESGMQALGKLLSSPHCRLQRLDLICQLPRSGIPLSVEPLSTALRINPSLRILRLSGNEIMEPSMLESLAVNQSLECLDWCGNGMEDHDLALLSHALSFNRTLKSLNLKSNRFQSLDMLNLSSNDTLCHLGHSCRGPKAQEIAFRCRLNAAGRRLLRENPTTIGLWAVVIEHCNQDRDAIQCFLQNNPVLWGN